METGHGRELNVSEEGGDFWGALEADSLEVFCFAFAVFFKGFEEAAEAFMAP